MLDHTTLMGHFDALGWKATPHDDGTVKSVHETDEGDVSIFVRLQKNWLIASVVPFLATRGKNSFELARWLLRVNRDMDQAKFAYDDDALMPEDRAILAQLARCVTTGPLKGKKLELTGRADPRGETEYNMILGEHRAASVVEYLSLLGVEPGIMAKTSRGELDAEGTDEDGWARDRRVDIALEAPAAAAAPRAATP